MKLFSLRSMSLRRYLLLGILLPVVLFVVVNTFSAYNQALKAVNIAYDRTLLASAKSIGEQLEVKGFDADARLRATVPYAALEAFEADNQSRIYYRVSTQKGEMVSGFSELEFWRGQIPVNPPYAALVSFYDDTFRDEPVRAAVLLQPVAGTEGRGIAVVQVAETLALRHKLAREILINTLWRQAALVAVIAFVVVAVVQRATLPVRRLSAQLQARAEGDLTPLNTQETPRELQPMVIATNHVMERLQHLLNHQKRFVRDTAHQLRTPLAVLKTQVQSALRHDMEPLTALREISGTVDRATALANQMLSLAKVEQLRQQADTPLTEWADVIRAVALDLSPLVADKDLDFELETATASLRAHDWMLRELTRNLLHNAIKHSPCEGRLRVSLSRFADGASLLVQDDGPGVSADLAKRLFQPFSPGDARTGSGLGLAICFEIVQALGGTIQLKNREGPSPKNHTETHVSGLDASVWLPLRQNQD
jgi:two-component system sensor histidine kinase TctE